LTSIFNGDKIPIVKQNKKSYARGAKVQAVVRLLVAEILRDLYPDIPVTLVDAKSSGPGLQFVRLFYQGTPYDFSKIKDSIRWELAARMNQKFVPDLDFVYDDTIETANRIEELLNNV